MKKIKLLQASGALLLAGITITMPIVLVSCSNTTNQTPPVDTRTPLEKYKYYISDLDVSVDQEAIDMLGTELYRHENGYNVLDLSHWGNFDGVFCLDVFDKSVNKVILPKNPNLLYGARVWSKLKNDDIGKRLWQLDENFALKGKFEINFADDNYYTPNLSGMYLDSNYIMKQDDINNKEIWREFGPFPISAFKNVSKIILDTKKNDVSQSIFEYASLPYAFSNVDVNDKELVEYNGKKYPGIVAAKELSMQAVSAIIPFSDGTRFLNGYTVDRQWPGFVKSDKTLGSGFYYAPLNDQSLKIFFTTLEDVNQFFGKKYDTYAKANLNDSHIQKNYQTMLKIFPHRDSTPQNPKIDWSSIQQLQDPS